MSGAVDIVIAGGGMVGATAALALARGGFDVAVIEAHTPQSETGKGNYDLRVSAISPRSERIFRALGAWQGIEARRLCPYHQMRVWDANGFGEIYFDCMDVGEPRLGCIIENAVIQIALFESLQEKDNVLWCCPAEIEGFELDGDGIDVMLNDGRRLRARLLIGADGPASSVRALAGIEFHARDYGQHAVVANVRTERPHEYTAWQRFLPSGPLAFLPLAGSRSSGPAREPSGAGWHCAIVWSTGKAHAESLLKLSDKAFCTSLGEAFGHRLGAIEAAGRRVSFPLRGGQAEMYVKPRIALAGDAAHGIHPLAGQGANLGITDAAVLVETLKGARLEHRDIGGLRALRRYARARRGENELMMRVMEGFNMLFEQTAPPVRWLRGAGLNLTDAAKPVKQQLMRRAMGL